LQHWPLYKLRWHFSGTLTYLFFHILNSLYPFYLCYLYYNKLLMSFFNFMQPFYIGGDNQQSVLAGFEPAILETAFNVS
jgi:hypothetical protein